MTGTHFGSDIRDCGGDVAAYALGALGESELAAFRAHLFECAVCREELGALEQVVEALAISAIQYRAPKGLRRRVIAEVEQKRGPERPRSPLWRGRARRPLPQPALALGAALAVIVLALVAILGTSAGAKTRVYDAQVTGRGSAELTVTGGHGELTVHRLPPPPAGQIYEVWLGRPGRPPAPTTALFGVTASGEGDVEVPGNLNGVRLVMVTPEPAGGTLVPTNPSVIRAQLS